jgi:DNA-binding MarR family transcriptional regulator
MSALLSGLGGMEAKLEAVNAARMKDPRLSRSLLAGLSLLLFLPVDGSSTRVTELAAMLNMSSSTAHRYVQTLLAVEMVERDPRTRRYRLAQ